MNEKTNKKKRLDTLLVEKGLIESRTSAKGVIMSGAVYVNGQKIDKPGSQVRIDDEIEVRNLIPKFVGRGGLKLDHAIRKFGVDVSGKTCLDIGASTGGFTDCLLQHGADKVYSVDVGYGQLHWKLRNDKRVIIMERLNARYLKNGDIGESVDIITIDVSFISMKKILTPSIQFFKRGGILLGLIKPQFEVGKGEVGKGGIVRDKGKHISVVMEIEDYIKELGLRNIRTIESPILGADGNKEFLVHAESGNNAGP